MPTQYDDIAEQYQQSKHVSWRYHIEQYSLFHLMGDITGLTVLDLACGEGHYSRVISALGAKSVVGIDISQRMIELARRAEAAEPNGIEYRICDVCSLQPQSEFDLVTAAYLLNYARDARHLRQMCRSVVACLKSGGRFVTVNNNPAQQTAHFDSTRKYGFIKLAEEEIAEGTTIRYRFFLGDDTFEIENYHLDRETHEWAMREAGLTDVKWHPMRLAPAAASGTDAAHWDDFFVDPPVILLEARKPA